MWGGYQPTRTISNLEGQGLHFIWSLPFDLFDLGDAPAKLSSCQHSSLGYQGTNTSSPRQLQADWVNTHCFILRIVRNRYLNTLCGQDTQLPIVKAVVARTVQPRIQIFVTHTYSLLPSLQGYKTHDISLCFLTHVLTFLVGWQREHGAEDCNFELCQERG